MIKEIQVKDRKYQIDTTPEDRHYAEVLAIKETEATGALMDVLSEVIGKPMVSRIYTTPSPEEEREVVLTAGWKFSKSKAWKDLFEYHYRRR
jgi:hypothetical protein